MANIRDVAKEAGVSPATVSRTFTTPGLINDQTQARVLSAATLLGYTPPRRHASRGAASTRSSGPNPRRGDVAEPLADAIGFQFFSATDTPNDTLSANHFYAPVLFGAQAEASRLGLHLLVHTTDRHSLRREMPRMIAEKTIGGLLLVGTADREIVESFARNIPNLVLVDNHDETGTRDSVVSDGFAGALQATRHLLAMGHTRIGFFLPEAGVMSFQDRLRGYRCAMIEAGILPDPALTITGDSADEDAARRAVVSMLIAPAALRPTAMLAANDDAALFLLRIAREKGLAVPDDLSLIGFDDTIFAQATHPALTTVRVEKESLGCLAVRCLYDRLRDVPESASPVASLPVRHVLPVSLVVRESCRPPRDP